jgi:hypothetical protein
MGVGLFTEDGVMNKTYDNTKDMKGDKMKS